jgi:hypothetical protein
MASSASIAGLRGETGLTSPASSSTSFRNAMRRTRNASSALLGSKLCLKQRSTKTSITPPEPRRPVIRSILMSKNSGDSGRSWRPERFSHRRAPNRPAGVAALTKRHIAYLYIRECPAVRGSDRIRQRSPIYMDSLPRPPEGKPASLCASIRSFGQQ